MLLDNWPELRTWGRIVIILIAITLAVLIAFQTRPDNHPDERFHIDAFRYFEENWWPPEYGSDEIVYSPYGWSRVYTGEIVYLFYGKLGFLLKYFLRTVYPKDASTIIYRTINIALFALTLLPIFFMKTRTVKPMVIGLVFVCVPQVIYIYSYANSDAFGVSLSVFLFLMAIKLSEKPLETWKWGEIIVTSLITGLIFTSKRSFLLAFPLPLALIAWKSLISILKERPVTFSWIGTRLIISALIIFAIAAPLKLIYPKILESSSITRNEMRDEQGKAGFIPSDPSSSNYLMARKGKTYYHLLFKRPWLKDSAESLYAAFGYWSVRSPNWTYRVARLIGLLSLFITLFSALAFWNKMHVNLRITLLLSPFLFIANTYASLNNSLYVDYQPQGRYLFPALVPLCFLLLGTVFVEQGTTRRVRFVTYAIMYLMCLFTLVFTAILNSDL